MNLFIKFINCYIKIVSDLITIEYHVYQTVLLFLENEKQTELKFPKKNETRYSCTYCGISFTLDGQLRAHCATENHQTIIMSDEGRDWKWRPPPRGFSSECYTYENQQDI